MEIYAELKAEKEVLEKRMEQAKKDEHNTVIKQEGELSKEFKITAVQLECALAEGGRLK
ncbi:MAG: hypothetical protein ABJM26_02840 [Anderseniella sp.]